MANFIQDIFIYIMHHIIEKIRVEIINLSMISKICEKYMAASKNRIYLNPQIQETLVFRLQHT